MSSEIPGDERLKLLARKIAQSLLRTQALTRPVPEEVLFQRVLKGLNGWARKARERQPKPRG